MKAVVLAAGVGSRLGSHTHNLPKPMLPVNGHPVLEQNIQWLASHGVRDLYLNLHYLPDVIRGHFGSGEAFGVSIQYSYEENLLGTAGAVRRIADRFWQEASDEPFFVIYGDNLLSYDLGDVQSFHRQSGGLGTIVVYHKDDVSQSGIVVCEDDGRIRQFIEKPKGPDVPSHQVNTGIYLLEPRVVNMLPTDVPVDFGHDIFPDLLAAGERLFAVELPGSLTPIDTPEMLQQAWAATGRAGESSP